MKKVKNGQEDKKGKEKKWGTKVNLSCLVNSL
jgi:hypothetical protein